MSGVPGERGSESGLRIHLGTGLDDVRFGWSLEDLGRHLGVPDKEWDYELEDRVEHHACFYELRSTFWFDENGALHWVECAHPDLVLCGQRVFGQSASVVVPRIVESLGEEPEFEDLEWFEGHFFQDNQLELQFEYDRLSGVNFGYRWSAQREPIWPGE